MTARRVRAAGRAPGSRHGPGRGLSGEAGGGGTGGPADRRRDGGAGLDARADRVSLDEALRRVLAAVRPLGGERVPLADALGRTLAREVRAGAPLPAFDHAAMDGFALRSSEAEGAAPGRPRALVVAGTAFAGAPFPGRLPRGAAVRIMTGAPLPAGADEVVPVEESEGGAAAGEVVRIFRGGLHFGNVRRRGEDLAKGALALPRGTRIGAAETALLAALGEARPLCARRPSVSILSIGDELVLPEERPEGGRVRDANGAALAAAVLEAGASPERLGVERDRARAIARRIAREVAAGADLLLVSGGGAKTGERDVTAEAVLSLGARPLFREVGLKPGKALAAYLLGRAGAAGRGRPRLLLSLPGNPVAALVGFWVAGRPALRAMQGARDPRLPEVPVRSPEGWEERPGRANLVRARLAPARPPAAGLVVEERLPEGAARLGALARANALLRYEGRGCAGDPVRAMLLPGVSFSWP